MSTVMPGGSCLGLDLENEMQILMNLLEGFETGVLT